MFNLSLGFHYFLCKGGRSQGSNTLGQTVSLVPWASLNLYRDNWLWSDSSGDHRGKGEGIWQRSRQQLRTLPAAVGLMMPNWFHSKSSVFQALKERTLARMNWMKASWRKRERWKRVRKHPYITLTRSAKTHSCYLSVHLYLSSFLQKTFCSASSTPWSSAWSSLSPCLTTLQGVWTPSAKKLWTFPRCCASSARYSASSKRRWEERI